MTPKFALVLLALSMLIACGSPPTNPAAVAPTTANPVAPTSAPAAATNAPAITDVPTAATDAPAAIVVPASPTTAPVADAIDAPTTAATTPQPSNQPNTQTPKCPPGWVTCQTLADPKITIMGSRAVSPSAMEVVAQIYTDITSRFKPAYPKNKFDGYIIYMTNGEPWSELKDLAPIGTMWPGVVENGMAEGDELRGGTNANYLWIDEQLICKKGIQTRNDAFAAGKRRQRDDVTRTFDQVIHEFGHAIDYRFGLRDRVMQVYRANAKPVERFPQSIQSLFGAPTTPVSDGERAFLNEIFSSSTTFSCDMYALSQVHSVKLEVGKQYALREANTTFRYFKLTSTTNPGQFPIRIDLCPNPGNMGWIDMPDATDLTTVETALAEKLTPKGEPCTTDVAPHGVFTNGTSLPNAAGQNAGQAVATPTTASQGAATATTAPSTTAVVPTQAPTAPPVTAVPSAGTGSSNGQFELVLGKQYALRGPNKTFQYIKVTHKLGDTGLGIAQAYLFDPCPNPADQGRMQLYDTLIVTSIAGAQTEGLTPTNAPCTDAVAPPYTGAPNTIRRSAPLKFEIGKQYVVRQADTTYEYHQLVFEGTTTGGATYYRGARCPDPGRLNQITINTVTDILTVEEALAANLTMTNAPCNPSQVPHGS